MFLHTWRKYLPVIILLMKRSGKSEQVLDMNQTDFERAAGGKKAKLTFSNLKLDNGRTNYDANYSPLAKDLILVLQENEQTGTMMRHKLFEFSLNSSFQLTIRNTTVEEKETAV
jgi:hypothetical protein